MSTEANIVRVECDLAIPYQAPVNKITGERIQIPRGRDVVVELGVRERGTWVVDLESKLASITVEVKATRTGAATVTVTDSGPFTTTTEGTWTGDTGQHASILLPNGQTSGFTIGSSGSAEYWMVITAATVSGKAVTLAAGNVDAIEDGGNYSATTPAVGDASYVTTSQFYSALGSASSGVISENGYQGRWGIDENGQPVWRTL
jgi:hypothetical protein